MLKTLVLKDNYNSFENYYLNQLNSCGCDARYYYSSSLPIRKVFTHYGLPFESIWYGNWRKEINDYELIIIFDSLHSPNLLKYIRSRYSGRLIFWHWNPVSTKEDFKIINSTREICEHWTFNPPDAQKYEMKLNNQFFFYQNDKKDIKNNSAFFVGADKGRYDQLFDISRKLKTLKIDVDFHVINKNKNDNRRFVEHVYMNYIDVLSHIRQSKLMVEIVQKGQIGLTARSLEAMFFETKLITNNIDIKRYPFYNKDNIFVLGSDSENDLPCFIRSNFYRVDEMTLYPYSGQGWINHFIADY